MWWVARRAAGGLGEEMVEEVAAEVRLQFADAARRFDPTKGFTFATFALWVARFRAWHRVLAEKHRGLHVPQHLLGKLNVPTPVSLGTPLVAGEDGTIGETIAAGEPEEDPEFPADFWERVRGAVTPRQYELIVLRFRDGLTHAEIARRLGVSHGLPHESLKRSLRRIRRRMPDLAKYLN